MTIEKLHFSRLRNEQHYQYHAEFKALVEQYNPQALKIDNEFAAYLPLFDKEDNTLKIIRKSSITDTLTDADGERDATYIGLFDAVKASLKHFNPAVAEAAKRVKIVFDTYGSVTRKPYDEESAAITNILQELTGKYAPDIITMGLTAWVEKLEQDNLRFIALVKDRYDDLNLDIIEKMPQVRTEIDTIYRTMVERINALVIIEGAATYQPFIESLNQRITHYRNVLKQREGRAK